MLNFEEMKLCAFIDESGSTTLITPDTEPSLYVCAAVIVPENHVDELRGNIQKIAKDLNQGSPLKHSRIGMDNSKRIKILESISKLNFQYIGFLVNKDRLKDAQGLKYKKSFYKFFNRRFYSRIIKLSSPLCLELYADKHGKEEFMRSVEEYFDRKCKDLFTSFKPHYVNDKDDSCIQLADIIAGTLSYCFEKFRNTDEAKIWRDLLKKREITLFGFPFWKFGSLISNSSLNYFEKSKLDESIEIFTLNKATLYLLEVEYESDEDKDEDKYEIMRMNVLQKFCEQYQCEDNLPILSTELIRILEDDGYEISKQVFMSKIIGGLRQEGFIISGSSNGYKLAICRADIDAYLAHNRSVIEPMLGRLKIARETVKTQLGIDILEEKTCGNLRAFVDLVKEEQICEATAPIDEESVFYDELKKKDD